MPGANENPMAGNQQDETVKSKKSAVCSLIRFQNRTERSVDVIWLNYEGARVKYKTLRSSEFVDVNTFVGHPWIFLDVETGERMVVELKEVFEPLTGWSVTNQTRKIVNITNPIYSLKDTCIRFFKRCITVEKIAELDLPESLKVEMKEKYNNRFRTCLRSSATLHQNGES